MDTSLAAPLTGFVAALILTPLATRLALRLGWVDRPGLRKVQQTPIAYLGGGAVMGALFIALAAVLLATDAAELRGSFDLPLAAILMGTVVMFSAGLVDDVRGMRPRTKLLVQLLSATTVTLCGVTVSEVSVGEYGGVDLGLFAYPLTIFWIVGATNALNIIDGLDGLASGLSAIGGAAMAWASFETGQPLLGVFALALMGSSIGFLPYNLNPARIYLGDAGSLSIGFLLATTAVMTTPKASTLAVLAVPFAALGVPILDTLFAMSRRLIERRSILSADKNHVHHRLIELGYSVRKTSLLLWSVTAVVVALIVACGRQGTEVGLAAVAFGFGLYVTFFRWTGSVRFRESAAAFSRVASAARTLSEEQQAMDEIGLRFREARSIDQWWSALIEAASRLSFAGLTLDLPRRNGGATELRWSAPTLVHRSERTEAATNGELNAGSTVSFQLPLSDRRNGGTPVLTVTSLQAESLESTGRRISHFLRLIQRHDLGSLPRVPEERSSNPRIRQRLDEKVLA